MSLPPHVGFNFVDTLHHDIYHNIDPTKSDLTQPSKVVLVTGAGRGIGRSIALRYAESGVAHIIICARTASELDSVEQAIRSINAGVHVTKFPLDITDEAQVTAAANRVKQDIARLDMLINNAGITEPWVPIAESSIDDYWNTWTVTIKSTSIGTHIIAPGASAYQTSRLALLRLTEFVDAEYGSKGVNSVAVHPGGVLTDLSRNIKQIQVALTDTPELCAGFVVWLTKGGRTWLAGRYVAATWDVDELEAKRDEIVKGEKLKVRMVV
ncbi:putative oxidoreductase ucpA [Leptodontidium sp. 2 PMI_412]|nr:putative oxidoreductase ucpA [Leptodontidium sp. MPI-SDFR-AT-0119]KAH9217338.1 putative oxidoreductase ucpA [Leptodontidium sp. 2 PMI_412]